MAATIETNPFATPCSSAFNHSLSTNSQLPLTSCRGNSITIDDSHAALNHSHSSSYSCSSSSNSNSNNINQFTNDCVLTAPLEIVCDVVINNVGVCEHIHVKKTAVSGLSDKNRSNKTARDKHDHNHANCCDSATMISSVARNCARKSSITKTKKDYHGCDYNSAGVQAIAVARPIINNDSTKPETSHTQKLIEAAKAVSDLIENHDHNRCGIAVDSRRQSQRDCMLQLASCPAVPKSLCDMKGYGKNNNGVLHGWLQAMRESSPPRTTSPTYTTSALTTSSSANTFSTMPTCNSSKYNHTHTESSNEEMQLIHRAWMAKHPSALDKLEEIVEAASGKRVAVFLDYDGTLSPIVDDPDRAFMSHQMRAIVQEVANVFPTAIISGRCKEKLHEFVQLPELYYAGSHGMDIVGPAKPTHTSETRSPNDMGKETVFFQPAREFTLVIDKVFKALEEKTKGVPGARVEHNKFCVSVHFRCVKEKHWVELAQQVHQVFQSYPNLHLTQGRKVLEIRPLIAWNKGKALDFLLKALGLGDQNTAFPIYLGDDQSDEDAFKVLNKKKHGLGILVSTVPKETNAVCSLRDPSEVGELLKRLVKWQRRHVNKYM